MNPLYVQALETRLRWLRWTKNPTETGLSEEFKYRYGASGNAFPMLPSYRHVLETASTFFMDQHFCNMVDHARRITPDELKFDTSWLHADCGWIYLEEPFYVPPIELAHRWYKESNDERYLKLNTLMRAVGWRKLPEGIRIPDNARSHGKVELNCSRIVGPGEYQFLIFNSQEETQNWAGWSHFVLRDGDMLGPRVASFEAINASATEGDNYVIRAEDTILHPLHEIRWVYTAMYLMAQRLASRIREKTDRAVRRRAERENQTAPPFIEIVRLRAMEQAREKESHTTIDWKWQWHVRGHWRDQWYPAEGIHKPKFIEAYMKGPESAPVKPPTIKLFAAIR